MELGTKEIRPHRLKPTIRFCLSQSHEWTFFNFVSVRCTGALLFTEMKICASWGVESSRGWGQLLSLVGVGRKKATCCSLMSSAPALGLDGLNPRETSSASLANKCTLSLNICIVLCIYTLNINFAVMACQILKHFPHSVIYSYVF